MNDNKPILRYNANERTNHWIVAILFFLAAPLINKLMHGVK